MTEIINFDVLNLYFCKMKDITTIQDIQLLVNTFYESVRESEIGFFFEEIAQVNSKKTFAQNVHFLASIVIC